MNDVKRIRAARGRWLAIGSMLALAGCGGASLPTVTSGPDAADPRAVAMPATYSPVTSGTVNHQPVAPASWRDMNDRVAPRPGGSR